MSTTTKRSQVLDIVSQRFSCQQQNFYQTKKSAIYNN